MFVPASQMRGSQPSSLRPRRITATISRTAPQPTPKLPSSGISLPPRFRDGGMPARSCSKGPPPNRPKRQRRVPLRLRTTEHLNRYPGLGSKLRERYTGGMLGGKPAKPWRPATGRHRPRPVPLHLRTPARITCLQRTGHRHPTLARHKILLPNRHRPAPSTTRPPPSPNGRTWHDRRHGRLHRGPLLARSFLKNANSKLHLPLHHSLQCHPLRSTHHTILLFTLGRRRVRCPATIAYTPGPYYLWYTRTRPWMCRQ